MNPASGQATGASLLGSIHSEKELDELLTRPRLALIEWMRSVSGPLLVLGASGKMGPSLCVLAQRASTAAGRPLEIIAASRFSDPRSRAWLDEQGVRTIQCDLLDRRSLAQLPDSPNVIYLVGMKFGTRQTPWLTWAVNTLAPAHVLERYPAARLVALSTGNVYPLNPVTAGGATEDCAPAPVGEYAGAALARERIFEYGSHKNGTAIALLRLNYAVELRYGVLVDIAQKVWRGEPLDLAMGHFNCIWQGDANEMILRCLDLATSPPSVFNLTGPTVLSVREVAARFARLMGRELKTSATEAETALLSNSSRLCARLGTPETSLDQVITWTADWIMRGCPTLDKPTHFEVRTGSY